MRVLERRRPAAAARDLPARLPARRRGRAAVDGDVLVQPHQRRLRVGGPVAAHRRCCATSGASRASSSRTGARSTSASPALAAGMDLEMPSTSGVHRRPDRRRRAGRLARRVACWTSPPAACSTSCARPCAVPERVEGPLDVDAHHALAREAAGRSIVLLKNDGGLLPLAAGRRRVAVIGEFADKPRYQGAGSSMINPTRLDNALDEIRALAGDRASPYAPGFTSPSTPTVAETARCATRPWPRHPLPTSPCVFLGLPAALESEGYDREDIDLPADQLALLDAVLEANPRTVVVLSNGGVVRAAASPTACPRSSRAGCSARPAAARPPTCCFGVVNPSAQAHRDHPAAARGHPAVPRLPGRVLARPLRRGPVRRLPLVRRARPGGGVPVRPRPLVHDVRVLRMPRPSVGRATATSRCA